MKLKILEVNMSRKKDANKYWIYGEDAALAAQFTAYLATVLKNRRLTYIRHLKKIQKVECSYEYGLFSFQRSTKGFVENVPSPIIFFRAFLHPVFELTGKIF